MTTYTPDRWVVVRLDGAGEEPTEHVLAGWSGGYLDSDRWRRSSPIERVVFEEHVYVFYTASGAFYRCHKNSHGMTTLSASIFSTANTNTEGMRYTVVDRYNPTKVDDVD